MKSTTTFNDRLARISAREGMGAELLAGVCETGNRPKVKIPNKKKKRKSNANPIFLSLLALGMLGAGYYYNETGSFGDLALSDINLASLQSTLEVTKVQFASYME